MMPSMFPCYMRMFARTLVLLVTLCLVNGIAFAQQPREGAAGAGESASAPARLPSVFGSEFVFGQVEKRQAVSDMQRGFIQNFALYEPVYFIMGFNKPAAKFQFSFQYQILANDGRLAGKFPFLKGLCFAYTQRSLWDITSDSSPFYDTSYMPEFFYAVTCTSTRRFLGFRFLGAQAGFAHESNGRGGPESRSMNKLFARAAFMAGNPNGWRFTVTPKVWAYVADMSDNPDLNDYRGYGELTLSCGRNDSLNVSVLLRAGQSLRYGAMQVDATYPVDVLFKNFAAFFLMQYWNGHGESQLNYSKRTQTVRFGISLVR